MKRLILIISCLVMYSSLTHASLQSETLEMIEEQGPGVWDVDGSSWRFVPDKGGIKVCKAENKIIAGFYLSDDDVSFYNQTFPDGNRKPIGFEFDIIDHSGVFDNDDIVSMIVSDGIPDGVRYDENNMLDGGGAFAVNINDPTKIAPNTWHYVTINFADHVDLDPATFEVQLQLVGDIRKLQEDYPDTYDNYSTLVKAEFVWWFSVGGGHADTDGNNFFNIRTPKVVFWKDRFFDGSEGGYDRYLWNISDNSDHKYVGDYEPYSCAFGSDPSWNDSNSDDDSGDGDDSSDGSGDDTGLPSTDPYADDPPPADNPGDGTTPWDGYDHIVGLDYVKAKWDSKSTWRSDLDTYLGEIENVDIRVKVKQKGGVWPSGTICAKTYLSGNRDFESKDVYLGKQCLNLKGDYADKDDKSFYISNKDIDGSGKIDSIKKYYLFTIIERDGTVINSSTENDGAERVGIIVGGHRPKGYVDALSCNDTVRGWVKDDDWPYAGIKVHIYASNPDGSDKQFIDSITADTYRDDLNGDHGWNWSIPGYLKKGKSKKYYFYGINAPSGPNPPLIFNHVTVPTDTLTCHLCNNPNLSYERCIVAIMLILD